MSGKYGKGWGVMPLTVTTSIFSIIAVAFASFAFGFNLCNFLHGLLEAKRDFRDYEASCANEHGETGEEKGNNR